MPAESSWLGKTTVASSPSLSGMTSEPSTATPGEDLLTWFRAGFPVRIYPSRARAQGSGASGQDSGQRWLGSFARWSHASSSWRTPQPSLFADSASSSVTWLRWGSMRSGACWARTPAALLTSESGCGLLLPTLTAWDATKTGAGIGDLYQTATGTIRRRRKDGRSSNMGLLPTLTVCGNYNRKGASKTSGDGLATAVKRLPTLRATDAVRGDCPSERARNSPSLVSVVRMMPTLTVNDAKNNGGPSQLERNSPPLNALVGGPLNPTWLEWFMGWPIGWTGLDALETDRFQQWCALHGAC